MQAGPLKNVSAGKTGLQNPAGNPASRVRLINLIIIPASLDLKFGICQN